MMTTAGFFVCRHQIIATLIIPVLVLVLERRARDRPSSPSPPFAASKARVESMRSSVRAPSSEANDTHEDDAWFHMTRRLSAPRVPPGGSLPSGVNHAGSHSVTLRLCTSHTSLGHIQNAPLSRLSSSSPSSRSDRPWVLQNRHALLGAHPTWSPDPVAHDRSSKRNRPRRRSLGSVEHSPTRCRGVGPARRTEPPRREPNAPRAAPSTPTSRPNAPRTASPRPNAPRTASPRPNAPRAASPRPNAPRAASPRPPNPPPPPVTDATSASTPSSAPDAATPLAYPSRSDRAPPLPRRAT